MAQQVTINLNRVEWTTADSVQANGTIARLDQLHPHISGNKYFKLKYNLQNAFVQKKGIITMGGAYSNHLAATAFACNEAGIDSVGLVRGELTEPFNHTLQFCTQHQMKLIAVPRKEYNRSTDYLESILEQHKDYLFVPEGGDNSDGEKGCSEIASHIHQFENFTHIACAVGTGTTARGLAQSLLPHQTLIAIPVLKIKQEERSTFVEQHLAMQNHHQVKVVFENAGKGYASQEPELFKFMNLFYKQTEIPLDFVYTAKMMMAISNLFNEHYFTRNDRLLVVHTGGLQGNLSLTSGTLLY